MKSAFRKWQHLKLNASGLSVAMLYFLISKNLFFVHCAENEKSEKSLQVNDDMDSQSILIELLDRGSLKYPSSHVLECIKVIYDLFSKIDSNKVQFDNFYSGSSRTKLVQLACLLWRN